VPLGRGVFVGRTVGVAVGTIRATGVGVGSIVGTWGGRGGVFSRVSFTNTTSVPAVSAGVTPSTVAGVTGK
jgi:hypothetical protein